MRAPARDIQGMADRPSLPFRMLRGGLKACSRAGSAVMEKVLRYEGQLGPAGGDFLPASDPGRKGRSGVKIRFGETTVEGEAGVTLLEVANRHDIDLRSYCGGNCSCGTCRVEILGGGRHLSKLSGMEEMVLGMEAAQRGDRLACQAQIRGDVEVRIPEGF